MKTKHEVIQLIVDLSKENEQLTKSILGNTIVTSAKESLNFAPDLKTLKIIAESILFVSKCIEDIEQDLQEMKLHNEKSDCFFPYNENQFADLQRQLNKYNETLIKVIREI